ncbi:MAG: hypothetical protein IJJ33_19275, partial [Victivallales bacterium]|nr:hypothetical protein [Victivallales bacterium]
VLAAHGLDDQGLDVLRQAPQLLAGHAEGDLAGRFDLACYLCRLEEMARTLDLSSVPGDSGAV